MPELPEVETTRRGLRQHLLDYKVNEVMIHQPALRWPVNSDQLKKSIEGTSFLNVNRRGKYLLFENENGTMICHLGMSGSMRIVTDHAIRRKHDHLEWVLENNAIMRFHDPRRFGCVLWIEGDVMRHKLLCSLGPEPLSDAFNSDYLFTRAKGRKVAIKQFIMDSKVVVGVGNIYASEALYDAGIHPGRQAGRISKKRYHYLVDAIRQTLECAIESGGTTLRDFVNSQGEPGYFAQQLSVYDKSGQSCGVCGNTIKRIIQGQRASYYCPRCQT